MMTWLLLATGCSGGLTLVFLGRLILRSLGSPASVQTYFTPGKSVAPLVALIGKARREVLLLAQSLASPALAQALVDAKLRGVSVEIVLDSTGADDPTGDYAFLVEQSLAPIVRAKEKATLQEHLLVVDEQTVATGSFPFAQQAEEKGVCQLVIVSGHPDFAQSCRQHFLEQRGPIKNAPQEAKEDDSPSGQLSKESEKPAKARLGKARAALEAATSAASATDGKARQKNEQREEVAASS